MENNTIISHELEQMRSQIGMLKQKLEQQTIVNDRHIRNSMKSNISDLNRTIRGTIIGGAFAVVFAPMTFHNQGCSPIFVIATAVMLAVCLYLTVVQKINLGKMMDFTQDNLVETAKKINKLRNLLVLSTPVFCKNMAFACERVCTRMWACVRTPCVRAGFF